MKTQVKNWVRHAVWMLPIMLVMLILSGCGGSSSGKTDSSDSTKQSDAPQIEDKSYRSVEIVKIEGEADVTREGKGRLNAYQGMMLQSGDELSVSKESNLVMCLDGDKYVMLEEGTHLELLVSGTKEDSQTEIHLTSGAVVNYLENDLSEDSSYDVTVPNGTMAVRGTVFRVAILTDEKGEVYTTVSVFEGTVAARRIYPDGSQDTEEEEHLIGIGKQAEIYMNTETTVYVEKETDEVSIEDLPVEVLKFLEDVVIKAEQKELCWTQEEIQNQIKVLEEENTVESSSQNTTDNNNNNQNSNSNSTASDQRKPVEKKNCKVSFYNGNQLFCTQTVTEGNLVIEPTLQPTESGSWDYDFKTPVKDNLTIYWRDAQ